MQILNRMRGSIIPSTLIISTLVFIASAAFSQLFLSRIKRTIKDWEKFAALETARSAFVLMEAALSRRLFEMPPDTGKKACLKRLNFSVDGTTPEGIEYRVDATYNPVSGMLLMDSTATKGDLKVRFEKQAKILDAGGFLAFSKGKQTSTLSGAFLTPQPGGMLAQNRRLYFEGPVQFRTGYSRLSSVSFSAPPSPMDLRKDPALIIQADRMSFLGGLSYYMAGPAPVPNNNTNINNINAYNALYPHYAPQPGMYWQYGNLAALLTDNYDSAKKIRDYVSGASTIMPSRTEVEAHSYPRALFVGSGTLPLNATTALDSADFLPPHRWITFRYSYGGSASFGHAADFSCYTDSSLSKRCSASNDFPLGFNKWIAANSLENTLFTSGSTIDFPVINWDNMEALEEDAAACGLVVTGGKGITGVYEDCLLADNYTVKKYLQSPTSKPCTQISKLNTENLDRSLKSFKAANYGVAAYANLHLRRVIYLKTPVEMAQTYADGIARNLDANVRKNMSLWLIAESPLTLKPFQPNTKPISADPPGAVRDVYFNSDTKNPTTGKAPLKLVLLSPESVSIISPFHKPLTDSELKKDYPVISTPNGNRIRPKFHIDTDYKRQENDGFQYGIRSVHLKNIDLITGNSNTAYETGFFLRGLWSGRDAHTPGIISGACMMDNPFDSAGNPDDGEAWNTSNLTQPPYARNANPLIPPKNSAFYAPAPYPANPHAQRMASYFNPWSFESQVAEGLGTQALLELTGLRAVISFDGTVPAGKKKLTAREFYWQGALASSQVDLSNRRFYTNHPYFKPTPPLKGGATCTLGNAVSATGGVIDIPIYVNKGAHVLTQNNPGNDFVNLGAIGATFLPTVEASN